MGYVLDGKWYIATRGAFVSEQARWASKWLDANAGDAVWPTGWTPLFEIVYPENQIVVRYDYEGLVLLSLVRIETGEELPHEISWRLGLKTGLLLSKPLIDR